MKIMSLGADLGMNKPLAYALCQRLLAPMSAARPQAASQLDILVLLYSCHIFDLRRSAVRERYPEIEPYAHGMLDVGDGNLVY
jgi:hypothetical protein